MTQAFGTCQERLCRQMFSSQPLQDRSGAGSLPTASPGSLVGGLQTH